MKKVYFFPCIQQLFIAHWPSCQVISAGMDSLEGRKGVEKIQNYVIISPFLSNQTLTSRRPYAVLKNVASFQGSSYEEMAEPSQGVVPNMTLSWDLCPPFPDEGCKSCSGTNRQGLITQFKILSTPLLPSGKSIPSEMTWCDGRR